MAKTLGNLTDKELELVTEVSEDFGIELNEALEICIADGTISENSGGNYPYRMEGYSEIKFFKVDPKSNLYKFNKDYKKANKKDLFVEDNFYTDINIPKDENGKWLIDEGSAVCLGEEIEQFIVLNVLYKGVRKKFDAKGTPLKTNFDTTYAQDIFKTGQAQMLHTQDGKSMLEIRDSLAKEYPSSDPKKAHENVPDTLKTQFQVLVLGLIKVDGKWKKVFIETTKRWSAEEALEVEFLEKTGKAQKYKQKAMVKIIGEDHFSNPLIGIVHQGTVTSEEFAEYRDVVVPEIRAIAAWQEKQREVVLGSASATKEESKAGAEDEETPEEDPFAED